MLEPIGASRSSGNAFASLIGGAVGRYHLLHHVASDDLARQFFARTRRGESIERIVVVRIAKLALGEDVGVEEAIVAECTKAMSLRDPHLLVPLEVAREKVLFTASEYVEGAPLGEITDRLRDRELRVPASIAVRIALDVLAGLEVAHAAGLIHGGIAPDAVCVGSDGVARLTDFGVHHLTERRLRAPTEPALVQLAYLSPEQAGGGACTPASDVFSLAAVLWEAITGRRLFLGKTDADTKRHVLNARVLAPSQRASEVPEALDPIFLAALSRDANSRPSVGAMRRLLEECGVTPATSRQLADFVGATCVRWLGHQRGLLRAHAVEPPTAALRAPAPTTIDAILPTKPALAVATPVAPPQRTRARSLWFVALLLVTLAVVAAAVGLRVLTDGHRAEAPRVDARAAAPQPANVHHDADAAASVAPSTDAGTASASSDAATPANANTDALEGPATPPSIGGESPAPVHRASHRRRVVRHHRRHR